MEPNSEPKLRLRYHGRILDHLGIQLYQSPVAALAELIANSWDADAECVEIVLPTHMDDKAVITVTDDGHGMTFQECQDRYLNVGYGRRGDRLDERTPSKNRPVLGRKGIGKLAGFGIAEKIEVATVSGRTGEKTVFEMDIKELRSCEYVDTEAGEVSVIEHLEPEDGRRSEAGTRVTLRNLNLARKISPEPFRESMSRRFLLHTRVDDFSVRVDGVALPDNDHIAGVEFSFPADYRNDETPSDLCIDERDWGQETLADGQLIRWRISFFADPIGDEELRGIAVFAKGKLAQSPFFFLSGRGLTGSHGQQYLSGRVEADYLDLFPTDLFAPERHRISWDRTESEAGANKNSAAS